MKNNITPPIITLVGFRRMKHKQGNRFFDPGCVATSSDNQDLTELVYVSGEVDINTGGEYVLRYGVCDAHGNSAIPVERVVEVTDE